MNDSFQSDLAERIDSIEEAYEFMLAYAAQGREGDEENSEVVQFLQNFHDALETLVEVAAKSFSGDTDQDDHGLDFLKVLAEDGSKAHAAIGLVLAQSRISSQLIDNLNGSIHLRALLTDLFLLDEVIKSDRARSSE
ncbi:MAG: hypothetical protein QGH75_01045 [Pseudomonadales bacterium]|jgi:hypothetical protein|nr:hypothetical protein [Pseudomonadales bacterium]|tara:strand:- start:2812 stop:3222 length:411 start_codon:yes stop_codon:yes gene_type:complete